jgi:hypothetical protein
MNSFFVERQAAPIQAPLPPEAATPEVSQNYPGLDDFSRFILTVCGCIF